MPTRRQDSRTEWALRQCEPRETGAPEKDPTGVELCRKFTLHNCGPMMPTTSVQSRDVESQNSAACDHVHTEHLGNQWAFYSQCVRCKFLPEYFPRKPTARCPVTDANMDAVEQIFYWLPSTVATRQKKERRQGASAPASSRPTPQPPAEENARATPGPAPTQQQHRGPTSADAAPPGLLRPKAKPKPKVKPTSSQGPPSSSAGGPSPAVPKVSGAVVEVPESGGSFEQAPRPRAGSAVQRRPTPAPPRRVSWAETGQSEATSSSSTPALALAAMRQLANLPQATIDTRVLLDQLEAQLSATSAADEIREIPITVPTVDMSPIATVPQSPLMSMGWSDDEEGEAQ